MNSLHRWKDPYCNAIGYIDFNSTGQCFVTGGYTEYVRLLGWIAN